ncbi:MAG: DUF2157 domain-containing protein [Paludibacteraceae bacterium]|nr:DUF2157 domain-containing protein [Paludibacteraceae bacterium]
MSIKKDIRELVDNKIIDQQTADRISNYYQTRERKINLSNINVTTTISVVAAILVGFGMISMIAYNWDYLPFFLRLIIGLIPWLATSFGCYYTLKNKADSKSWTESMAVLHAAGFTSSVSLINQIYQVQLDGSEFILVLILANLPFIFIFQSAVLSSISISFSCLACLESDMFISISAILLADIAFLYHYYYRKSQSFLCSLRIGLLPIFLIFIIHYIFVVILKLEIMHPETFGCAIPIFASYLYILHQWINGNDKIQSNGKILKTYFYLLFFISLLVFSRTGIEYKFENSDYMKLVIVTIPILVYVGLKTMKKEKLQWQTYAGVLATIIILISGKDPLITSLFFLAIIAGSLFLSYKNDNIRQLKYSILLLSAWTIIILSNYIHFSRNLLDLINEIFGCLLLIMSSIFYAIYDLNNKNEKSTRKRKLSRIAFYLVFFPTILYYSNEGIKYDAESMEYLIPIIVGIAMTGLASFIFTKKKFTDMQTWMGILSAFIIVLFGKYCFIISFASLSIIVYCLYSSARDYDQLKMNFSIIALLAWAFIVLSQFELPFFIYGLILILLGVALIIMNKYIIKKKKGDEITENK